MEIEIEKWSDELLSEMAQNTYFQVRIIIQQIKNKNNKIPINWCASIAQFVRSGAMVTKK